MVSRARDAHPCSLSLANDGQNISHPISRLLETHTNSQCLGNRLPAGSNAGLAVMHPDAECEIEDVLKGAKVDTRMSIRYKEKNLAPLRGCILSITSDCLRSRATGGCAPGFCRHAGLWQEGGPK